MKTNNKILFVSPKNIAGGAERVMTSLVNKLSEIGDDIVFTTFDSDSNFYPIDSGVKKYSLNSGTGNLPRILKYFFLPFIEIKRYSRLKRIIKNENPDCVISFLFTSNILSIMICHNLNIPVILSERNDPQRYSKLKRMVMNHYYSKANGFVTQSTKMKDYAINEYSIKKVIYIPNPLNDNQISTDKISKNDKIISVGRLIKQKNQKLLIDVFSKVHKEFDNYKLYIYGEGNQREKLESQIKELKLEDYVFLPGIEKDVLKNNRDAKLFILSSDWEGYPNVLIEAMANGICSISSDFATGSAQDVIENGVNGFLFDVGNEQQLFDIIKQLLNDEKRMEKISEEGKKIFDIINVDIIAKEWKSFINLVIGKED